MSGPGNIESIPPEKRSRGRPKGSKNKLPVDVRAMVCGALASLGGQKFLEECGRNPKDRQAFLALVGRVLPKEIVGEGGGPVTIQVVTRFDTAAQSGQ